MGRHGNNWDNLALNLPPSKARAKNPDFLGFKTIITAARETDRPANFFLLTCHSFAGSTTVFLHGNQLTLQPIHAQLTTIQLYNYSTCIFSINVVYSLGKCKNKRWGAPPNMYLCPHE
jgi:hypothetical protein